MAASGSPLAVALAQKRALVGFVDRDFANADYCALNGVDRDTAYRDVHELIDRGFVAASGSGAAARYRVVVPSLGSPGLLTPVDLLKIRMHETGFITNADYREAFGVDRFAATAELADWVAEGVLVREGERRGTRYRPGAGWPPF